MRPPARPLLAAGVLLLGFAAGRYLGPRPVAYYRPELDRPQATPLPGRPSHAHTPVPTPKVLAL